MCVCVRVCVRCVQEISFFFMHEWMDGQMNGRMDESTGVFARVCVRVRADVCVCGLQVFFLLLLGNFP